MFLILEIDSLNGDSDFFLNVAINLSNLCGFSFTNLRTAECEILYSGIVSALFYITFFIIFRSCFKKYFLVLF